MPVSSLEIFCCYARKDQSLLNELKIYLNPLQRYGLIKVWTDTDISPGVERQKEIDLHLNTAHIILLLVSPDFMASDYCCSIGMKRAIERHESGEALVIPVILRYTYWQPALFGKLQVLPTNAKPVTDPSWRNRNVAFHDVAEGIRKALENRTANLAAISENPLNTVKISEETTSPSPPPLQVSIPSSKTPLKHLVALDSALNVVRDKGRNLFSTCQQKTSYFGVQKLGDQDTDQR